MKTSTKPVGHPRTGWLSRLLWRLWRALRPASSGPRAALRVIDDGGQLLADVALAGPDDYLMRVELPSGPVVVDLYPHYRRFAAAGGRVPYISRDHACRSYVKCGACMQDELGLRILIQPAKAGAIAKSGGSAM